MNVWKQPRYCVALISLMIYHHRTPVAFVDFVWWRLNVYLFMQLVSADTEKLFILHLELNFFFFLKSWKLNKETSNYISSTLNLTKNHIKIVLKTKQRNLQYFFQHELNHCHEDLCPNTNQYVSSFKIPLNGILHLWHVKYPPGREICHGIWSIRNNSQAIVPSVLGAGQFCYLVLSAWLSSCCHNPMIHRKLTL